MKIIVDRETALKAVCELFKIHYYSVRSVNNTIEYIYPQYDITFDFEKKDKDEPVQ